jgi:hypothetical protein
MDYHPQQRGADNTSPIPAYRCREGEEKIIIESPSHSDCKRIHATLTEEIPYVRTEIEELEEEHMLKVASQESWSRKKEVHLNCHQQTLEQMEDYLAWLDATTHRLGHLEATSGLVRPPTNEGRKDWAIIKVTDHIKSLCQNRVRIFPLIIVNKTNNETC